MANKHCLELNRKIILDIMNRLDKHFESIVFQSNFTGMQSLIDKVVTCAPSNLVFAEEYQDGKTKLIACILGKSLRIMSNVQLRAPEDATGLFEDIISADSIDINDIDFSEVTISTKMFKDSRFHKIIFDRCNFQKVKSAYQMFYRCFYIESIHFPEMDMPELFVLDGAFSECSSLKEVYLHSNTPELLRMEEIFYRCIKLTSIDIRLSTEKLRTLESAFEMTAFRRLDLSWMRLDSVCTFDKAFKNCIMLESIDFGRNRAKPETVESMFDGCRLLEKINLSRFNFDSILSGDKMFAGCTNLRSVIFNTKHKNTQCISTIEMFYGCKNLINLDLSWISCDKPVLFTQEKDSYNPFSRPRVFTHCSNLKAVIMRDEYFSYMVRHLGYKWLYGIHRIYIITKVYRHIDASQPSNAADTLSTFLYVSERCYEDNKEKMLAGEYDGGFDGDYLYS